MSNFTPNTSSPSQKIPDPTKHVNFELGMVLGDDDFNQEFAYLSGRDQWLARDLLGYGTVCGLDVIIDGDISADPRIEVAPGVALSPRGQLIRVDPAQCAYLNAWIADNGIQSEMTQRAVGLIPPYVYSLYLTLCYRDCYTDNEPVPGEPCRTEVEGELLKPSRIQDDFTLELRWEPPDQQEENALRDFVAWLRQVKVTEIADESFPADPDAHLQQFADAVRQAALPLSPPASPPDFLYGSPPADLKIPGSRACEYLRLAFRIWVTELRPLWRGQNASCVKPTDNDCVLLAALHIPVSQTASGWAVDTARLDPIKVVDEALRPYLIHLRTLQEWMTCGREALLVPADHVVGEKAFDQVSDPGVSELYSRADHTHGTPPRPFLEDDVTSIPDDNTVSGLHTTVANLQGTPLVAASPVSLAEGDVLTLKNGTNGLEWQPEPLPDLDGEVTGPLAANRVASIQSLPVDSNKPPSPQAGQVLMLKSVPFDRLPIIDLPGPGVPPLPVPIPGLPRPGPVFPGPGSHQLQWKVADLPEISLPNLDGDVVGSITNNNIQALQGKPVDAANPTKGQVLRYVRASLRKPARWVAADLPVASLPDLNGDVVDSPTQNSIKYLQKNLVNAPDPVPGQVLTFVDADDNNNLPRRWVAADPQTGNAAYVTRPQTAGAFAIVAAGVCEFNFGDASQSFILLSRYNQFEVLSTRIDQALNAGVILIKFTGHWRKAH